MSFETKKICKEIESYTFRKLFEQVPADAALGSPGEINCIKPRGVLDSSRRGWAIDVCHEADKNEEYNSAASVKGIKQMLVPNRMHYCPHV